MEKTEDQPSFKIRLTVWLCRIIVGATFIISGWAKSVDPWGFVYKIEEYLNVWSLSLSRELTLTASVSLSVIEFATGIIIFVGAMRRGAVWIAMAFMGVMLPLTVWIAVADPVSDCGCFGDFIVLSNVTTLIKNIILSALVIVLFAYNGKVKGLYSFNSQWLVVTAAVAYPAALAFIGYRYQPLVDFRPYPVGAPVISESAGTAQPGGDLFVYEKDGERREFTLDCIPDSTWTFIEASSTYSPERSDNLVISDQGDDITEDLISGDSCIILLVISNPDIHSMTRSRLANQLSTRAEAEGWKFFAIIAAEDEKLEAWTALASPDYPVYSAEDTALKELVRGDAALVWINNGIITRKLNLVAVDHNEALHDPDFLSGAMTPVRSATYWWMTGIFLLWMLTFLPYRRK